MRTGPGRSADLSSVRQPSGFVVSIIGAMPIPTRTAVAMATNVEATHAVFHLMFRCDRAAIVGSVQGHASSNMIMGSGFSASATKSDRTIHIRYSVQMRVGFRERQVMSHAT